MANATFASAIERGGFVTVMNAKIYNDVTFDETKDVIGNAGLLNGLTPKCEIDHFKTANLNGSGPSITITGGQYANPLIKFGKTMKCEMQMALCQIDALEALGAVEVTGNDVNGTVSLQDGDSILVGDVFASATSYNVMQDGYEVKAATGITTVNASNAGQLVNNGTTIFNVTRAAKNYTQYSVTNRFGTPVTILGDTFIVDQKTGNQVKVKILIYHFLPDSVFNLTQDASNAATFDMNGDVLGQRIKGMNGAVFYSVFGA